MSNYELNPATADELTYCAVHPDRETSLRCNKCERYMCAQCAVQTPVGYRCKECARQHEDKFFSATQNDNLVVFGVTLVLAGIAGAIVSMIGFLFLALILGLPAGGAISEAALRAVQRRRGRQFALMGAAGAVIGGLLGGMAQVYLRLGQVFASRGVEAAIPLDLVFSSTMQNWGLLLFVGLVAAAVYGRFRIGK